MSTVTTLIARYNRGSITFDELKAAFAARKWPDPVVERNDYDVSFMAEDGSWHEVDSANAAGLLTDAEYDRLYSAVTS